MTERASIAALEDVPADGTLLFHLRRGDEETEAIVVRVGEHGGGRDAAADAADDTEDQAPEIRAYENVCQHWTDVALDDGDGASLRNGEVVCEKHGATFALADGTCTFGPCEGAVLPSVPVAVEDGEVVLTDPDDEFLGLGPTSCEAHVGDEGDDVTDLSSNRGLGF